MYQEVGLGGDSSCLGGGELEDVDTKALEEGSDVGCVSCGVHIVDDVVSR